jgi:mRNA-degrading endonuclease RelE of RelBE toxin-antitoxin system
MFSFIETSLFTRLVQEYLSDDEYRLLQSHLIADPESGDVVPGSNGVRKLRWRKKGSGKRGGYRVIYFVRLDHGEIWMLTMYSKSVKSDIPADKLRQIRKEIDNG